MRKSSRQLQVLLGKNRLLFVVETYHTFTFSSFVFSLYNSQAQPMSTAQRPPKSTTEMVPGPDVTRVRPSSSSRRTAEVRRSSHVDARSSTTKILGPGPNTGYALALLMMQNRVLLIVSWKSSSSFLLFFFFSFSLLQLLLDVLFVFLLLF